jgi:hypothetical protein
VPILTNDNLGFLRVPSHRYTPHKKEEQCESCSFYFVFKGLLPHRRADRAPEKLLTKELELSERSEFSSSQQL